MHMGLMTQLTGACISVALVMALCA